MSTIFTRFNNRHQYLLFPTKESVSLTRNFLQLTSHHITGAGQVLVFSLNVAFAERSKRLTVLGMKSIEWRQNHATIPNTSLAFLVKWHGDSMWCGTKSHIICDCRINVLIDSCTSSERSIPLCETWLRNTREPNDINEIRAISNVPSPRRKTRSSSSLN